MSEVLNKRKLELAADVVKFVEQYNDCINETDVLRKCESVDDFDALENEVTIAIDTGNIEALSEALI
jgi:hypothetical protein